VTARNFLATPIISGKGKATDFKFCRYIHRVHPNKNPLKILEKTQREHSQRLPKISWVPLLSQKRSKPRISIFTHTRTVNQKKTHKNLGKVDMGVVRESQKFSGHSYIGHITLSCLRQNSLLVTILSPTQKERKWKETL